MKSAHQLFVIVRQLVIRFFADRIAQSAAELAYFLLFSLFPLFAFVSTVLSRLQLSLEIVQPLLSLLPSSLQTLLRTLLTYNATTPALRPSVVGMVLTLYFLSRAVRSMMRTVDAIYHIETERTGISGFLLSITLSAGFLVAIVLSFILLVAGRTLLRWSYAHIPALPIPMYLVRYAGFFVMLLLIFVFLVLFNYIVPNRKLRLREIWLGSLLSLLAWLLISWGFSFYVDNLSNYSLLYGSLGTIMVLMLWLYLISVILLVGPLLNHILLSFSHKSKILLHPTKQ